MAATYRWSGAAAMCVKCKDTADVYLLEAQHKAMLVSSDAKIMTLHLKKDVITTGDYEIHQPTPHEKHILLLYQEEMVFLFRFEDVKDGEDFRLYLESQGRNDAEMKNVDDKAPTSTDDDDDPKIKEIITSYLTDPSFQDYVHQVERLWDQVVAELENIAEKNND